MQRNNFSTGEQKGKKSSFSVPLKNYSFRIFSLSSFSLLLHYPLELRFVFEKLAENLSITPLLFTEDYIVSKLNFDDYTCLRPFLSEQDYSKLLSREEDDNPCLVKFYYRDIQ